MSWALWNTILMDLNSAFQCILCGCMWGLSQYERPAWTTGSLIPLGFVSGIGAGVLIWQGWVLLIILFDLLLRIIDQLGRRRLSASMRNYDKLYRSHWPLGVNWILNVNPLLLWNPYRQARLLRQWARLRWLRERSRGVLRVPIDFV